MTKNVDLMLFCFASLSAGAVRGDGLRSGSKEGIGESEDIQVSESDRLTICRDVVAKVLMLRQFN